MPKPRSQTLLLVFALVAWTASILPAQEPPAPWREDAQFKRLAAALDGVRAIDNHTHLRQADAFNPDLDRLAPLLLRSTNPALPAIIQKRFGVVFAPAEGKQGQAAITKARDAMVARLTEHGYWLDHLDYTGTDVALINTPERARTDGGRLRWVPFATIFLYPLPAQHLVERSPAHQRAVPDIQKELQRHFADSGLNGVPADLPGYLQFVDSVLSRWQNEGAVAVKFTEAYFRTLRIADIPESRASGLYARGRNEPLSRDDYIALQDYLWRHILL